MLNVDVIKNRIRSLSRKILILIEFLVDALFEFSVIHSAQDEIPSKFCWI